MPDSRDPVPTVTDPALAAEMYQLLAEQVPAILYRASLNELSETVYISPRVAELGYTPEEWLADPDFWAKLLHPDDRDEVFRQLAEFRVRGGKLVLEYRLRHRNGEWRDFQDFGQILHDGTGKPICLQGVMIDCTERRREEADLHDALAATAHFREALDHVDAFVYMKDRESRYFYGNQRTLKLFGRTAESLLGAGDDEFLAPSTVQRVLELDRHALAGENTAAEVEVLMLDGSRHVFWDVKSPIYLDEQRQEIWGISGIATDITAYKEMEENLAFLNRRGQILLELPRLADTLDEAPFMQRSLELAEELTGSCISFIHFVNPDEESIELVTWSSRTLESYCTAAFDRHYPVSQAGIWAEALRRKQAVVFNDYAAVEEKHGLPAGHAELKRLISLPVMEQGKVVMLAGIGNKPENYSYRDIETLQILANDIWRLVQNGRSQRKIERFSRVIEGSLNEIFTFDAATLHFLDANRGARENIGYTLDELRRMTPLDIKPLLSASEFDALLAPLRAGKESFVEFTTVHQRKDGTTYDVDIHLELTDDSHPLFVAVVHDVTRRAQLEQSYRQLVQAVEQSPESIAITDLEGNLRYVNAAFLATSGYSREEVLGENPRFLQSGKTPRTTYLALWDALIRGNYWEGELFNRRKDGSEYVEWARISPIRQPDGKITHYLAIKQNITARRQAELNLRQALQVVEASPVVSFRWLAKPGWPVEYVSQNVSRWGYRAADLLAGEPAYIEIIHPDDLPKVVYEVSVHTAAGDTHYSQSYRIRTVEGRYFWVEDVTHVIRDANNDVIAYEGVVTDVDVKKRYEQELAANLAEQKALNRKLEDAQTQLLQSEKMASIGQLAAGVAHELNNPIGFVSSNLGTLDGYLRDIFAITDAYAEIEKLAPACCTQLEQVLTLKREKDYDFLRDDIFQLMAESKDGLTRVAKIVKDLKDFSRAGEAAMQWANLHQGLDSTLNIVWNELKYKCTVTKKYGELPQVWCEPSQLNQVFMNLLVNAGHAIADKGEITITTGCQDGWVFVAITDTGSGIAPEHLSRIFDPFFTTKPVGKGTGLGLSLAYSIVQKHKGRIEVHSEVGKGTVFTVWLPIKPTEETAPAVPPAPTLEKP